MIRNKISNIIFILSIVFFISAMLDINSKAESNLNYLKNQFRNQILKKYKGFEVVQIHISNNKIDHNNNKLFYIKVLFKINEDRYKEIGHNGPSNCIYSFWYKSICHGSYVSTNFIFKVSSLNEKKLSISTIDSEDFFTKNILKSELPNKSLIINSTKYKEEKNSFVTDLISSKNEYNDIDHKLYPLRVKNGRLIKKYVTSCENGSCDKKLYVVYHQSMLEEKRLYKKFLKLHKKIHDINHQLGCFNYVESYVEQMN